MLKTEYLKTIIDEEESTKRSEKSKYFTEEFFEMVGIKKYKNLFEEYDELVFKSDTFYKLNKDDDEIFNIENYIVFFTFDNENVENGINVLMGIDERHDIKLKNEEKDENYNPYWLTDNFMTISYWENISSIYISKVNKGVYKYWLNQNIWDWKKIANSFDELIDNLYLIPKKEKELSQ